MLTEDFDFELPDRLIAQQPAERGKSRMMVVVPGSPVAHRAIGDLPDYLRPGDLLVVNDTRVIPARLFARRAKTGGRIEILLAERQAEATWACLIKPGRKAKPGARFELAPGISIEVIEKQVDGRYLVRFSEPIGPHLEELGQMPLPPYIKRPDTPADRSNYQTIFANEPGAIAAPTAGLHFTDSLVRDLRERGVGVSSVTLHVGLGTFKPVTADLVHEHRMDEERYEISEQTVRAIEAARSTGGRIVAVGTTVVRTLEGAAADGLPLRAGRGRTDIFIRPGHDFRVVDALLTNFHLPKSTLLMLVSAFVGRRRILDVYRNAVENDYRFFSYGDAMLLTGPDSDPAPAR